MAAMSAARVLGLVLLLAGVSQKARAAAGHYNVVEQARLCSQAGRGDGVDRCQVLALPEAMCTSPPLNYPRIYF